jgi:hypothetical protein
VSFSLDVGEPVDIHELIVLVEPNEPAEQKLIANLEYGPVGTRRRRSNPGPWVFMNDDPRTI